MSVKQIYECNLDRALCNSLKSPKAIKYFNVKNSNNDDDNNNNNNNNDNDNNNNNMGELAYRSI